MQPGIQKITECLVKVTPYVHQDKDHIVVFFGALSNLGDLLLRRHDFHSRRADRHAAGSSTGAMTSELILDLYKRFDDDDEQMIMLSELQVGGGAACAPCASVAAHAVSYKLQHARASVVAWAHGVPVGARQDCLALCAATEPVPGSNAPPPLPARMARQRQGQYAFVIYDNHKRQAFAARDPSGAEPLYYQIGSDGCTSFTNSPEQLPSGDHADSGSAAGQGLQAPASQPWVELPPGHYMIGKAIRQFALTPAQLETRERTESLVLGEAGHVDDSEEERDRSYQI